MARDPLVKPWWQEQGVANLNSGRRQAKGHPPLLIMYDIKLLYVPYTPVPLLCTIM